MTSTPHSPPTLSPAANDDRILHAPEFELVIIGGGPAGLSAALTAGRARRRVLVLDGGIPRNQAAPALHTFVTRDGILPREFRRIAREQIAAYPSVHFREGLATDIQGETGHFTVTLQDGTCVVGRLLLLALGLVDELPEIPGLRERWGKGVHHCVYCDGYEHRDQPWGVLLEDFAMAEHCPFFLGWTSQVTVFTHGQIPPPEVAEALSRAGMKLETVRMKRLQAARESEDIEAVILEDDREVPVRAFWVMPRQSQTPLVQALRLDLREDGAVQRSESGETSRPGIFAAGDLSAGRMQQALLAAAEGARVTAILNRELVMESLAAKEQPTSPGTMEETSPGKKS